MCIKRLMPCRWNFFAYLIHLYFVLMFKLNVSEFESYFIKKKLWTHSFTYLFLDDVSKDMQCLISAIEMFEVISI